MDFTGIISWFSDALSSEISALVSWVAGALAVLYGDIANVESFAGGLGSAVASLFSTLWTWLTSLWQWIHDNIVKRLGDLLNTIKDKLQKILGPILKQIRQMIAFYKWWWTTYIKPLYDFLQRIRRALVIFRLLGFKWAQELDAKIQAIESKLTSSFLAVLTNLNTLADWINYILDPFGLIQPNVWLSSIAQSVGAILGIFYGTMNDPGFTSNPLQYSTPADYYKASTMQNRVATRAATGTLPEDDACVASLRASAAALGYTS